MSRPGQTILLEETLRQLRLPTMVRDYQEVVRQATETHELLDRLTHHCAIHEFGWESLRFTDSLTPKHLTYPPVALLAAATDAGGGWCGTAEPDTTDKRRGVTAIIAG